ncbi:MAG: hypothetical protein IJ491_02995 [Clostridia bacterium]|nr:hypothetical protein [Clostridia bacterium]
MDGMQVMLGLIKRWISRLRQVVAYLQESFLPDEETEEESGNLIWWF